MTRPQRPKDEFWTLLWRESLAAMSLGWELALPIFGGVLLGYFLDQWIGTRYIFTMGLLMLGIAGGFYNIWRFIARMDARQQKIKRMRESLREGRRDEDAGP